MNLTHLRYWAHRNRRLLGLKAAVACALVAANFFPESKLLALATNIVWLLVF